jgi:hypothetical protein
MKTSSFVLLLLSFSTIASAAEIRTHYSVLDRQRKPAFEVTRIHTQLPDKTTRTYLIADDKGPLLKVTQTSDIVRNTSETHYELMRGSKASANVGLQLPTTSTTREAQLREIETNPGLANARVPVSIEGPAQRSLHADDAAWRTGPDTERHRTKAKDIVGKDLAKALDDVRELAGLPMFADINGELVYFFDEAKLVRHSMRLMVATVKPDCAFDARFGVGCAR